MNEWTHGWRNKVYRPLQLASPWPQHPILLKQQDFFFFGLTWLWIYTLNLNPGKTSRQEGPTLRHLVLTSLSRKLAQFWATKDLKHFTPLQGDVPATFRCPTPSQTSQTLLKHSPSVICSQLIKFPSVRGNRCSKACSINVLFMTYVLFIISLFIYY